MHAYIVFLGRRLSRSLGDPRCPSPGKLARTLRVAGFSRPASRASLPSLRASAPAGRGRSIQAAEISGGTHRHVIALLVGFAPSPQPCPGLCWRGRERLGPAGPSGPGGLRVSLSAPREPTLHGPRSLASHLPVHGLSHRLANSSLMPSRVALVILPSVRAALGKVAWLTQARTAYSNGATAFSRCSHALDEAASGWLLSSF